MDYLGGKSHGKLVMSAVSSGRQAAVGVDDHVLASWKRCVGDYHLDAARPPKTVFIEQGELRDRKERCATLLQIAQSEMANLYQQVAGTGYSILLTDVDGVVLNYVGDPIFTSAAAHTGLQAGAVWKESVQGTNGIGTCLVEKRPLVIHQSDHFFAKNAVLTCSAAPIFDPSGRLVAVLDASSESRMAQQHTMVLVNMSAQLIENRLFLAKMRDHYVLRFHSRPEFVGTLGEGALAFDTEGRIRAANRSALFQLNQNDPDALLGRPLEEVFNIRSDTALEHAHGPTPKPVPLHEACHGRRFFVSLQPPAMDPRRRHASLHLVRSPASGPLDTLQLGDVHMQRNIDKARRLVEKDIPFLILGETGTGKEVFARALHSSSSRHDKPFVAVNCASIPETLIESELFGYRPGAFTGASREGSRGKILQADGGTLFLDEIGDMPLNLQARLLRVLEEREVVPLGGETREKVDIRVISATHQDLATLVSEGQFREDLYYRLNGLRLTMPPLREREDRGRLIRHLLELEAGPQARMELDGDAREVLEAYSWPGNIRQLRNVLRAMAGLCEGNVIHLEDLPEGILDATGNRQAMQSRPQPSSPLAIAERDTILRELEAARWNVTRVAAKLNISRNTLYRKMNRYGVKPPR
jgi:sigma-54 dependent transcriptional regulator, acetoin dehydrogenase operon transcriptional activator AcoR